MPALLRFAFLAGLVASVLSAAPIEPVPVPSGFRQIIADAAKSRFDMNGGIEAGFIATIQKDGIGVITHGGFSNIFKYGIIHHGAEDPVSTFYSATRSQGRSYFFTSAGVVRDLDMNEKVYIRSVDFLKGSLVVIHFQTCGVCNLDETDPADVPLLPGASFPLLSRPLPCILLHLPAHGTFSFQLGKPYLSSATLLQIEEVITSVFAPVPDEAEVSTSTVPAANRIQRSAYQ